MITDFKTIAIDIAAITSIKEETDNASQPLKLETVRRINKFVNECVLIASQQIEASEITAEDLVDHILEKYGI